MKFLVPDEFKGVSGIYIIKGGSNPYIGSTKNLWERFKQHRNFLEKGTHKNVYLQNSFNLHKDKFTFELLEVCDSDKDILVFLEQKHIDQLGFENLMNLSPTAGSSLGRCESEETRTKKVLGGNEKNKTGYRWVHLTKKPGLYQALHKIKGKTISLGYHTDPGILHKIAKAKIESILFNKELPNDILKIIQDWDSLKKERLKSGKPSNTGTKGISFSKRQNVFQTYGYFPGGKAFIGNFKTMERAKEELELFNVNIINLGIETALHINLEKRILKNKQN